MDATTISKYVYSVNFINQRTNVTQTGTAFAEPRDIAWGYDPLGQVTSADSCENTQDRAYQYDTIGNRQRAAAGILDVSDPTATVYGSNTLNQYTTIQENSANNPVNPVNTFPTYDQDGNTLTEGNKTHTWDAENRLIKVQIGETEVSYQYDSQSRRIQKIEHQHGTDPNNESQITNNFFPYRFSTKPLDSSTNLYYYGYRDYEAPTGRWKSRDPIEENGGLNIYEFVGNNSLNYWDRLGLSWEAQDCCKTEKAIWDAYISAEITTRNTWLESLKFQQYLYDKLKELNVEIKPAEQDVKEKGQLLLIANEAVLVTCLTNNKACGLAVAARKRANDAYLDALGALGGIKVVLQVLPNSIKDANHRETAYREAWEKTWLAMRGAKDNYYVCIFKRDNSWAR